MAPPASSLVIQPISCRVISRPARRKVVPEAAATHKAAALGRRTLDLGPWGGVPGALDPPMLDRMYKDDPEGTAPPALEPLAGKIRAADAFVFVAGEYNWGVQPGLKNLTDHFLEEGFWRPAAIASHSAGCFAGVRSALSLHAILSEMGTVVVSSALAVGGIGHALGPAAEPTGEGDAALAPAFPRLPTTWPGGLRVARIQRARAPAAY